MVMIFYTLRISALVSNTNKDFDTRAARKSVDTEAGSITNKS
jgi:hypothetical protein